MFVHKAPAAWETELPRPRISLASHVATTGIAGRSRGWSGTRIHPIYYSRYSHARHRLRVCNTLLVNPRAAYCKMVYACQQPIRASLAKLGKRPSLLENLTKQHKLTGSVVCECVFVCVYGTLYVYKCVYVCLVT